MQRQVQAVDQACNRQLVEGLHELLVDILVVKLQHLVSEVKRLSHVARLVVSPQKNDILRRLKLETEQVGHHFRSVVSSIDVVAHEQNLVLLVAATLELAEHGNQVVKLAMDVAHDHNSALNSNQVGLRRQNSSSASHDLAESVLRNFASFEQVVFDELCVN